MLVDTHSVFKRWQLALTAVNIAQCYNKVLGRFWMGTLLESLLSLPPFFVGVATRYTMYKARCSSDGLPLHLQWMLEPKGQDLLCSEEDIFDPRTRTAGPHGRWGFISGHTCGLLISFLPPPPPHTHTCTGSPLLRATYIYLKQCLNDAFHQLLYPDQSKRETKLFADIHASFRCSPAERPPVHRDHCSLLTGHFSYTIAPLYKDHLSTEATTVFTLSDLYRQLLICILCTVWVSALT